MTDPRVLQALEERLGGSAGRDAPLGALTTYRVGGPARLLAEVADEVALRRVAQAVAGAGGAVDVLVVGNGSNLLVADAGFDGLVVRLGLGFTRIDLAPSVGDGAGGVGVGGVGDREVDAGGAVLLPVLARTTAAAGLTGLEWAVGVPGSVGGAVRMNAGGHGSDVAATIRSVRLLDLLTGEDELVRAAGLDLGYRHSSVRTSQVVVSARFGLRTGDAERSQAEIGEIVRWRREHQPGGQNAGSVFTNPVGDSAGRLVEQAGCKGLRLGTAEVSSKHANFIQADPGGSADDVRRLIDVVIERVERETGVRLTTELRLVGFGADRSAPNPASYPDPLPKVEG